MPILVGFCVLISCDPSFAQLVNRSTVGGPFDPDKMRDVKSRVSSAVEDGVIAGAAHLVGLKGRTAYFHAAGVRDIDTGAPMNVDTIVRIYSMTKPITSVAAMRLYEQGRFNLDDALSQYIPAFANVKVRLEENGQSRLVDPKRPPTVRDLFRHTTGYGYDGNHPELNAIYRKEGMKYRAPEGMLPPDMTIEAAAEKLATIPLMHHPGEKFTYGFNTDLLGRLIEIWAGEPLDEHMSQAIFEPLEMTNTHFVVPKNKQDRFASCHTTNDGKLEIIDKSTESQFTRGFAFLSGGGGLVSTITDYANFCQMMIDGGRFKNQRILKEETVELMFSDQLSEIAGDFQFGLGFAIEEVKIGSGARQRTGKQYSWGGYASTSFRLVPSEKLYQIYFQQHVPSRHALSRKIFPMVYAARE